jgi:hypothetical protein
MSHKFTTPRVVYLGQGYRGRDDRASGSEPRLPKGSDRAATSRLAAPRMDAAVRASAR